MPKKITPQEKVRVITPQQLIGLHEANVAKSLETYRLKQRLLVHFPKRTKPPLLGRLGVFLVNMTGGIIATKYEFVGDTINSKSRRKK